MFNLINVSKYHEQGYKGQGINFLNGESNSDHNRDVLKCFNKIALESITFNGSIGCRVKNGVVSDVKIMIDNKTTYDLIEFIKQNNIKIMSASLSTETNNEPFNIWLRENVIDKLGVIVISPAGNHYGHICGIYKYCGIVVGACGMKEDGTIYRHAYSGQGELLNFITFIPYDYLCGTSFAAPSLAGQIALLLSKYGDMNQYQVFNLLRDNCMDIGDNGRDNSFGYGLPILPLKEVVKMNFKDTQGHWAEKDINKAVTNGIVNGYADGTFRPDAPITRAEATVLINRTLEIMKNR